MKSFSAALVSFCLLTLPALAEQPWIPLFNGVDLSGWTPKFAGQPCGENFAGTFRV